MSTIGEHAWRTLVSQAHAAVGADGYEAPGWADGALWATDRLSALEQENARLKALLPSDPGGDCMTYWELAKEYGELAEENARLAREVWE